MTKHSVRIARKYFEPVRKSQITLLIFNKKVISEYTPGDEIFASYGSFNVSAPIRMCKLASFGDLTEDDAKEAGFISKDFLRDELVDRFDLRYSGFLEKNIDKELFFCVYLEKRPLYNLDLSINTTEGTQYDYEKAIRSYFRKDN